MQAENAKNCRLLVQELNLEYAKLEDMVEEHLHEFQEPVICTASPYISKATKDEIENQEHKASKWAPFLASSIKNAEDCEEKLDQISIKVNLNSSREEVNFWQNKQSQKLDKVIEETQIHMENKFHTTNKFNGEILHIEQNSTLSRKKELFENNFDDLNFEI